MKRLNKDKDFWRKHKPQLGMPFIHYDPYYTKMYPQTYRQNDDYPEFVNTDDYKPSGEVYFDTKDANKIPKDQRLNYFLPPLEDANKKTNMMYPTVLSDDIIMTRKGVYPRTSRKGGMMQSYSGPVGRAID